MQMLKVVEEVTKDENLHELEHPDSGMQQFHNLLSCERKWENGPVFIILFYWLEL